MLWLLTRSVSTACQRFQWIRTTCFLCGATRKVVKKKHVSYRALFRFYQLIVKTNRLKLLHRYDRRNTTQKEAYSTLMATKLKMLKTEIIWYLHRRKSSLDRQCWPPLRQYRIQNFTIEATFHIYTNYTPKMFNPGYILPLIDYGSSTWGTTSRSYLERLSKLQKRALRIIRNAPYDTASSDMLSALGYPSGLVHTSPSLHKGTVNNV